MGDGLLTQDMSKSPLYPPSRTAKVITLELMNYSACVSRRSNLLFHRRQLVLRVVIMTAKTTYFQFSGAIAGHNRVRRSLAKTRHNVCDSRLRPLLLRSPTFPAGRWALD